MLCKRFAGCLFVLLPMLLSACASSGGDGAGTTPAGDDVVQVVREAAIPITGAQTDYDSLMAVIGDARFVLLGESTHGTHEFYRERARITQRLVREKGFSAVAIEGEWPDAMRVSRFIRGEPGAPATAEEALAGFTSGFPEWMWANTDIRDLANALRTHNQSRPMASRVSFYGLDVYSMFESADSVIASLRAVDPAAAQQARDRYACFARHRPDPQAYGAATRGAGRALCREQAEAQVAALEARYQARTPGADPAAEDDLFSALQNARAVAGAEAYFRVLYEGGASSWNERDQHMARTLEAIVAHLEARGQPPKVVVWAHNTHAGDARLTEMGQGGELNVGQLMRQRYADRAVLVGFTTYEGRVLAAEEWGTRGRERTLNPALPESYASTYHRAGIPAFLLTFRGNPALTQALAGPRLERAVGVVYMPSSERQSHYFMATMSQQFDAVIHVDRTTAVTPLRTVSAVVD